MSRRIIVLYPILMLTFYVFISSAVEVYAQSLVVEDILSYGGLRIILERPAYVNSSSVHEVTFNVTFTIKAEHAELTRIIVNITTITTFIEGRESQLLFEPVIFEIPRLDYGYNQTETLSITIPGNASGAVVGEMFCSWIIDEVEIDSYAVFKIPVSPENPWKKEAAYWRQAYENLSRNYDELNKTRQMLQGNLTILQDKLNEVLTELNRTQTELNQTRRQLEDKMGELGVTQRLAVIFGVTTALFVFTTAYMFKRKQPIW